MRLGGAIIIGGVILIVAGIAVGAVGLIPIFEKAAEQSQVLSNEPISPGSTKSMTLAVSDTARQLSAVISSTTDSSVPLRAVLKAPDASVIADSSFHSSTVITARPPSTGLYALSLTNEGNSPATVNAIFGYLPQPSGNQFGMFTVPLAGGIIVIIGFAAIILGVVVALVRRRPRSLPSAAA